MSKDNWESDLSFIIEQTNKNLNALRKISDDRSSFTPSAVKTAPIKNINPSSLLNKPQNKRYNPHIFSTKTPESSKYQVYREPSHTHYSFTNLRQENNKSSYDYVANSNQKSLQTPEVTAEALRNVKTSLEVNLAARSKQFENQLSELRTDFNILSSNNEQLQQRCIDALNKHNNKNGNPDIYAKHIDENAKALSNLQKQNILLTRWKSEFEQAVKETSSKLSTVEGLERRIKNNEKDISEFSFALKMRPSYEIPLDALSERISCLEKRGSSGSDSSFVQHMINMQVNEAIKSFEVQFNQKLDLSLDQLDGKYLSNKSFQESKKQYEIKISDLMNDDYLRKEVDILHNQNNILEKKLNEEHKSRLEVEESCKSMQRAIEELGKRISVLNQSKDLSSEKSNQNISQLKDRLIMDQKELDSLRASKKEIELKLVEYQNEQLEQHSKAKEMESEKKTYMESIHKLSLKLATCEGEINALTARVKDETKLSETCQNNLAAARAELVESRLKYESVIQESETNLSVSHEKLKAKIAEIQEYQNSISHKEHLIESYIERENSYKKVEQNLQLELSVLKEKLCNLNETLNQKITQHLDITEELNITKSDFNKKVENLQSLLKEKKLTEKKLQIKLSCSVDSKELQTLQESNQKYYNNFLELQRLLKLDVLNLESLDSRFDKIFSSVISHRECFRKLEDEKRILEKRILDLQNEKQAELEELTLKFNGNVQEQARSEGEYIRRISEMESLAKKESELARNECIRMQNEISKSHKEIEKKLEDGNLLKEKLFEAQKSLGISENERNKVYTHICKVIELLTNDAHCNYAFSKEESDGDNVTVYSKTKTLIDHIEEELLNIMLAKDSYRDDLMKCSVENKLYIKYLTDISCVLNSTQTQIPCTDKQQWLDDVLEKVVKLNDSFKLSNEKCIDDETEKNAVLENNIAYAERITDIIIENLQKSIEKLNQSFGQSQTNEEYLKNELDSLSAVKLELEQNLIDMNTKYLQKEQIMNDEIKSLHEKENILLKEMDFLKINENLIKERLIKQTTTEIETLKEENCKLQTKNLDYKQKQETHELDWIQHQELLEEKDSIIRTNSQNLDNYRDELMKCSVENKLYIKYLTDICGVLNSTQTQMPCTDKQQWLDDVLEKVVKLNDSFKLSNEKCIDDETEKNAVLENNIAYAERITDIIIENLQKSIEKLNQSFGQSQTNEEYLKNELDSLSAVKAELEQKNLDLSCLLSSKTDEVTKIGNELLEHKNQINREMVVNNLIKDNLRAIVHLYDSQVFSNSESSESSPLGLTERIKDYTTTLISRIEKQSNLKESSLNDLKLKLNESQQKVGTLQDLITDQVVENILSEEKKCLIFNNTKSTMEAELLRLRQSLMNSQTNLAGIKSTCLQFKIAAQAELKKLEIDTAGIKLKIEDYFSSALQQNLTLKDSYEKLRENQIMAQSFQNEIKDLFSLYNKLSFRWMHGIVLVKKCEPYLNENYMKQQLNALGGKEFAVGQSIISNFDALCTDTLGDKEEHIPTPQTLSQLKEVLLHLESNLVCRSQTYEKFMDLELWAIKKIQAFVRQKRGKTVPPQEIRIDSNYVDISMRELRNSSATKIQKKFRKHSLSKQSAVAHQNQTWTKNYNSQEVREGVDEKLENDTNHTSFSSIGLRRSSAFKIQSCFRKYSSSKLSTFALQEISTKDYVSKDSPLDVHEVVDANNSPDNPQHVFETKKITDPHVSTLNEAIVFDNSARMIQHFMSRNFRCSSDEVSKESDERQSPSKYQKLFPSSTDFSNADDSKGGCTVPTNFDRNNYDYIEICNVNESILKNRMGTQEIIDEGVRIRSRKTIVRFYYNYVLKKKSMCTVDTEEHIFLRSSEEDRARKVIQCFLINHCKKNNFPQAVQESDDILSTFDHWEACKQSEATAKDARIDIGNFLTEEQCELDEKSIKVVAIKKIESFFLSFKKKKTNEKLPCPMSPLDIHTIEVQGAARKIENCFLVYLKKERSRNISSTNFDYWEKCEQSKEYLCRVQFENKLINSIHKPTSVETSSVRLIELEYEKYKLPTNHSDTEYQYWESCELPNKLGDPLTYTSVIQEEELLKSNGTAVGESAFESRENCLNDLVDDMVPDDTSEILSNNMVPTTFQKLYDEDNDSSSFAESCDSFSVSDENRKCPIEKDVLLTRDSTENIHLKNPMDILSVSKSLDDDSSSFAESLSCCSSSEEIVSISPNAIGKGLPLGDLSSCSPEKLSISERIAIARKQVENNKRQNSESSDEASDDKEVFESTNMHPSTEFLERNSDAMNQNNTMEGCEENVIQSEKQEQTVEDKPVEILKDFDLQRCDGNVPPGNANRPLTTKLQESFECSADVYSDSFDLEESMASEGDLSKEDSL